MADYIGDNNLNMSVKELVCEDTIKSDMLKSKRGLDDCFKEDETSPKTGFIRNSEGEPSTAPTNTTNTWTDKHYDFTYTLTEEDIESGKIKIDPYFVAYQWKLGKKDDSGALWHCFKNIARFGEKNTVEREIKALHAQIKRLAELNGVTL